MYVFFYVGRCECEASELREGKEKLQKELVASRSHMQNNQLKAEVCSSIIIIVSKIEKSRLLFSRMPA